MIIEGCRITNRGARYLLDVLPHTSIEGVSLLNNPEVSRNVDDKIAQLAHDNFLTKSIERIDPFNSTLQLRWLRLPPQKLALLRELLLSRAPRAAHRPSSASKASGALSARSPAQRLARDCGRSEPDSAPLPRKHAPIKVLDISGRCALLRQVCLPTLQRARLVIGCSIIVHFAFELQNPTAHHLSTACTNSTLTHMFSQSGDCGRLATLLREDQATERHS